MKNHRGIQCTIRSFVPGGDMKFKRISIRNFRNFENIDISLDNKNIFFGMNDIGKTNFLYALRFIFDKTVRKNNLIDTDFYEKNIDNCSN